MENVTEDAFNRIQKMLDERGPDVPTIANISMSTEEKHILYHDILSKLQTNVQPQEIARQIVVVINEFIDYKMTLAKQRKEGKSPIFRRVD